MLSEQCLNGIHLLNEVAVDNNKITGKFNEQKVFEIPTSNIANCTVINNDVVVELNDENQATNDDALTEIRFFVHGGLEEESPAEILGAQIREKVQLEESTDSLLCVLPELPFSVPRGKYSADFYTSNFRLHGSSYNYTCRYSNVTKLFLLPMPDRQTALFIIGFDKPLKQGQTSYKYAVIQFKVE